MPTNHSRRIVLFSDPHIAGDPHVVERGVNMAARFQRLVGEIVEQFDPQTPLVCLGDLARNCGLAEDYAHFARLVEPLSAFPFTFTLGNHDCRELAESHFPSLSRHAVLPLGDVRLIVLDSLETGADVFGSLGTEQLAWLDDTLARETHPTLVMLHHPPLPENNIAKPVHLLDGAAFWRVVSPQAHVKAVVYGHLHRPEYTLMPDGIHLIGLPSSSFVFRERDPAGYVVADVHAQGAELTMRVLDGHWRDGERLVLRWR